MKKNLLRKRGSNAEKRESGTQRDDKTFVFLPTLLFFHFIFLFFILYSPQVREVYISFLKSMIYIQLFPRCSGWIKEYEREVVRSITIKHTHTHKARGRLGQRGKFCLMYGEFYDSTLGRAAWNVRTRLSLCPRNSRGRERIIKRGMGCTPSPSV